MQFLLVAQGLFLIVPEILDCVLDLLLLLYSAVLLALLVLHLIEDKLDEIYNFILDDSIEIILALAQYFQQGDDVLSLVDLHLLESAVLGHS